jgi:hypothetical protein
MEASEIMTGVEALPAKVLRLCQGVAVAVTPGGSGRIAPNGKNGAALGREMEF